MNDQKETGVGTNFHPPTALTVEVAEMLLKTGGMYKARLMPQVRGVQMPHAFILHGVTFEAGDFIVQRKDGAMSGETADVHNLQYQKIIRNRTPK